MKAFIVYCHPSEDSFTRTVRDSFIKGVVDSGNEYILSDLYKMDFKTDMTEKEYLRDANYNEAPALAPDVLAEQEKINSSDAIVFIYPVFSTEAPAKLVGRFDRVFTFGFAYGNKRMKKLDKGLILCTAGNYKERLENFGLLYSMKKVMLGDRLFDRVKKTDFIVFDGMTKEYKSRTENWDKNLKIAYESGKNLFKNDTEAFSVDDKLFVAVENSESGEVSADTVFSYHQKGDNIWAEYSGGKVVKGFLIGKIDKESNLHFTYQHINTDGEQKSGSCDSTPKIEGGKLRFYENWQWASGEKGSSVIEEI